MTAPMDPHDPNRPGGDPELATEERQDRRAAIAIVAVLVVAAVVALVWWLLSDDDEDEVTTTSSTTTTVSTTTTSTTEPTTTSSEAPFAPTLSDEELATVVWPDQDTSRRFSDPGAAAQSFATDYLGFAQPVLGEFMAGDSRSGEVEVRPRSDGPVTTVLVRQLGDDSWWVLGAQSADLQLDEPAAGATLTSPVRVSGSSRAFEGTVEVELRADGSTDPVGSGFVTGGAGPELGPFSGELEFDAGDAEWGALLLTTTSAEDGSLWQATVVRVRFG